MNTSAASRMGKRSPSVAIIGTGFSGIGAAIKLEQAGFENLTIFERADGIGGVWRHNTYPGAASDVPSFAYSYSFEPNPRWSRACAPQIEIQRYLEHCAAKHGLTEHLRFGTEIAGAVFDAERGKWTLETTQGDRHEFDIVVAASGQLTVPRFPNVEGLDSFEGAMFHSALWDNDHDFTGERVAVVGNAASAVQLVPQLAKQARQLTVFQRSAEYLIPKPDFAIPEWLKDLQGAVPATLEAQRLMYWLMGEWWNVSITLPMPKRARQLWNAPFQLATRAQLRLQVRDPELREKLTPNYEMFCKRAVLSSNYYPAVTKSTSEVVTDAITEITPNGVVTDDGVKRNFDTIVFATGFQANGFVAPMKVTGLDGRELNEVWQGSPQAYLGMSVPGFPNFFLMYGPNTNLGGGSVVYMVECQARYIADAIRKLVTSGAKYLDVKQDVYDAHSAETQRRLKGSVWANGGCTSWYKSDDGKVTNNWQGLMSEYRLRTRRLNLSNYELAK
ncbi:flavin-containing monooxygenase [Nocardia sp. NPDC057663]|uniref:flavin-containing monooxygenase n=1 Tax=Nocardia sp. NPDC057663 TaxID=3346201 RepID=UPI003672B82A